MAYPHNGILLGHKREQSTDTLQHGWTMETCQVKEDRHKGHMLYDSLYMKCQE